ncbi:MAG: hypothetical protein K2F87_00240 [Muribaculaceae bacterium]|nr:hypothetical protein [Muribaculaceae bacterium]
MASEVKTRLLEYLHYKRISQVEFTRMLGVSSTYVGAMRRSISGEKMLRIRELFPDLNPDWLLYGHGEMLIGDATAQEYSLREELAERGASMVPLVPTSAAAGSLRAFSEGVRAEDCETIVAQVEGAELAVRVSGRSMEPYIPDGSFLFVCRIKSRNFIPWGHPMVIDTADGVVVKCLYPVEAETDTASGEPDYGEAQEVEARSYNPAFPPFRIPGNAIYGLYRVLGVFTLYTTI